MNELTNLLLLIKNSLPNLGAKKLLEFYNSSSENKEILEIILSLTIHSPINFNVSIVPNKNTDSLSVLDNIGKVYYWLQEDNLGAARAELKKMSVNHQQIIASIFNKSVVEKLGVEFLLNSLDNLYELSTLFSTYIKLPTHLDEYMEEHLEGLSRSFDFSNAKFPAVLVNIPKSCRKKSRLYYIIKRGNSIKSNLSNKLVRDYFIKNFHYNNFGCIFMFSKKANRRHGKQLVPICLSKDYKSTLNLYRGNTDVNLSDFDFSMKQYFPESEFNYIEVRHTQNVVLNTTNDFSQVIPKILENNLLVFSNGLIKVLFRVENRVEKVLDYILDEDYMPIGLVLSTGEKFYRNLDEDFIDKGLDNRFITVTDTKLGSNIVRSNISDVSGAGMFMCKCCGAITKTNLKSLCSPCYTYFRTKAQYSNKDFVLVKEVKEDFSITLHKYEIVTGNGEVTFKLNYDLIKGKQMSLPFGDS
ncbi:MAG: hypothetical protein JHC33_03005, partial [Ignisphaera sp.]|nr:hypothetical protein [Ignisphaera sp.]